MRHSLAFASGLLIVSSNLPAGAHVGAPRTDPQEIGKDFALAACLTQKGTGMLREEGFSLASIALHRSGASPDDFSELRGVVATQLSRTPMTNIHVDGPVGETEKPALLAHCVDIIRSSPVRAAIARLRLPR